MSSMSLHPNDKPLVRIEIKEEIFFLSPKKGWLWAETGRAPTSFYRQDVAEMIISRLSQKFPEKIELFERRYAVNSRKTAYYRVRALFTKEDLHDFRGKIGGQQFKF